MMIGVIDYYSQSPHPVCLKKAMRLLPILSRTAVCFLRGGGRVDDGNPELATMLMHTANCSSLKDLMQPFDKERYQRRIILVRHGETDWNKRGLMQGGGFDIELNENGKLQANRVAQEMMNVVADRQNVVLVSSHLQRAAQTANILQQLWKEQYQHLEIIRVTMKEFGEMRFGDLEGNALRGPEATPESQALFRNINYEMTQDKHLCWPGGGESTADVQARGLQGLDTLTKRYPDSDVLVVVAHGRFNKILLASLLYEDVLKHSEVEQGNTCINVIDQRKDGTYDQVVLNYLEHLYRESK